MTCGGQVSAIPDRPCEATPSDPQVPFQNPAGTGLRLDGDWLPPGFHGMPAGRVCSRADSRWCHLGAAEAGLITMVHALAILPMMPLAGRLTDRFGARPFLLVGLPLVALSNRQFTTVDLSTGDWTLRWMLAFRGVTLGLVMMPSMTTAMNAAPAHLLSRAPSLTNVSRQVFGSFVAAMFVTWLRCS